MSWLCRIWHTWKTTHVNRYQVDTRQECLRCGAARVWVGGPEGQWAELEVCMALKTNARGHGVTVGGGLVRMGAWLLAGVFIFGIVCPLFGELAASIALVTSWLCGVIHLSIYADDKR